MSVLVNGTHRAKQQVRAAGLSCCRCTLRLSDEELLVQFDVFIRRKKITSSLRSWQGWARVVLPAGCSKQRKEDVGIGESLGL